MTSPALLSRFSLTFIVIAAITAVAVPAARQTQQSPPKPAPVDPHQQMNMRGNEVMGFDQDKTAHHFLLFDDGGAIDVSVKAADDTRNRDAIRSHLPHIAMMFGNGDFSAPMLVHSTDVPGTKELASFKDKVQYKYVETSRGGRVDIVTIDKAALDAVHRFLRFQITDHKTGDSGRVEKAPLSYDRAMPALRIGDLASRSGFSRDAIRYYERIGLLGAAHRTDGGYRVYGDQALNRLRVIRNARLIGFSLAEIRGFMTVRDAGGAPCAAVRRAAERRLEEISAELKHLEQVRRGMRRTLARWDEKLAATPTGNRAGLLEDEIEMPELRTPPRRLTRPERQAR